MRGKAVGKCGRESAAGKGCRKGAAGRAAEEYGIGAGPAAGVSRPLFARYPSRYARGVSGACCGSGARNCRAVRFFRAFYYLWRHERVEIRQDEDCRGLRHPDCGLRPLGRLCLPGGGAFFDLRRQLCAAALQAQRRGTDPLPPLPGGELRPADDCRVQVLRGALQARAAHRARVYRLAARPDRRAGFPAEDAPGQHRPPLGRQGAAHDEPAALDSFGGHGQPAGEEHPRDDRSGGQRGQRRAHRGQRLCEPGAAGHGYRGRAATQTQLFPAFRRFVQPAERGFGHRDFPP